MQQEDARLTSLSQAEFLYKVKPKLPQQFKAAEQNGVPFALILGEVCSLFSTCPPNALFATETNH